MPVLVPNISSTSWPLTDSSKISSNWFSSNGLSPLCIFLLEVHSSGGGKKASTQILNRIKVLPHGLFDHVWDESAQQRWTEFKARICIDLDEPRFQVLIDHEIQAKKFKVMLWSVGIQTQIGGLDSFFCYLFHFWENWVEETVFVRGSQIFVQVALQFLVAYFVTFLILTILLCILLNSVVCEMD